MSAAGEEEAVNGPPGGASAAGETPPGQPVQVTVSAPEEPTTFNLTVKPETPAAAVVSAPAVNKVEPEDIRLTPVAMTTGQQTTTTSGQSAPAQPTVTSPVKNFQPQQEDFYRTIFYFSGMGRVIGSALAEGVYVDEKNRRNAIDPEEVERYIKIEGGGRVGEVEGELVKTARSQAVNLSSDFRKLQSLLGNLPTFTDVVEGRGAVRGVDDPIHGEIYFRSERPELYQQQQQQQQLGSHRQRQTYIIEPSSQPVYDHHQQNGRLINIPWSYHSSY